MTDQPERLSLSTVLPRIMKFLGKVGKDECSPHQEEAQLLATDLLMAALLGLSQASATPEGRERVEAALNDRAANAHDPYNGRS